MAQPFSEVNLKVSDFQLKNEVHEIKHWSMQGYLTQGWDDM
jgi:hypothetical protein